MGKIKKFFADLTAPAFAQMITTKADLMATKATGYVPDAKAVADAVSEVNGKLNNISVNVSGYEKGINISNYTYSNPYILPKSGLVTASSTTSNQSIKAVIGIVEMDAVASATYPIPCSLYLPKGTKVFNRAYEGTKWSSTPASYSYLLFYAEK